MESSSLGTGLVQIRPASELLPSAPIHPDFHLFEAGSHQYVLVSNGSRLYSIEPSEYATLRQAEQAGDAALALSLLTSLGLDAPLAIDDAPVVDPPVLALSLAVAQKCNLGCTYCYAQEGSFGGTAKEMPRDIAFASVERLIRDAPEGSRVNLSFLGGEPLYARDLIHAATAQATRLAAEKNVRIGFSITTNGSLIDESDADFFERHSFAVSISLDGIGEAHDRLRPFKNGKGSFERIMERVSPLLLRQHHMQVSARVTVTPHNLGIKALLDDLLDRGFHSVGFSPMLSSPSGEAEMGSEELAVMLAQMIECGEEYLHKVMLGQRYAFTNMTTALKEIHLGTHRPYPCGAGAGYLGVSAEGGLSACHRFVNDDLGFLGNLESGVDPARREKWLQDRHVHRQQPCRSCWARYMCGGGCHHEVLHRGRVSCEYIRGWLSYCLQAYVRLLECRADFF